MKKKKLFRFLSLLLLLVCIMGCGKNNYVMTDYPILPVKNGLAVVGDGIANLVYYNLGNYTLLPVSTVPYDVIEYRAYDTGDYLTFPYGAYQVEYRVLTQNGYIVSRMYVSPW